MNIIYFIAIAAVVIYIASMTFKRKKDKQHNPIDDIDMLPEKDNADCLYDTQPESMIPNIYPSNPGQQLKHDIGDNFRYISSDYGCKRPVKSIKDFHKDFFAFRDAHTNDNTSIRYDPVDAMADIKLSGGLDRMDGEVSPMFGAGTKISDIYDRAVAGHPSYSKKYNSLGLETI